MIVIVAGDRAETSYERVCAAIKASPWPHPGKILHGDCGGVDKLAERYAKEFKIPFQPFPYIRELGKKGGPARNRQMVERANALIAIPGPQSRGTWDCIRQAVAKGLPVFVWRPPMGA